LLTVVSSVLDEESARVSGVTESFLSILLWKTVELLGSMDVTSLWDVEIVSVDVTRLWDVEIFSFNCFYFWK